MSSDWYELTDVDEDEYGNTDLDYGYPKEDQERDKLNKALLQARKEFETLCKTTNKEHILDHIEDWTLRDYVSEAKHLADLSTKNNKEYKQWQRFVNRYTPMLTDNIKSKTKHLSKYDN